MRRLLALLPATALVFPAGAQVLSQNTRLRSHVSLPSASWVAGNWGYRTATHRYLLQTMGSGGLAIVDTTDPANATLVRHITGISVKEVKVYGNHAYASTDSGPTRVIDLSDPPNASVVNSLAEGAHTLQIDADNGRLYLNRSNQGQLRILDVAANPVNPPLLAAHPVTIHDCNPEGDIVYVSGGSQRACVVLDVSNLPAVTQIASFPVPGGYLHSADLYRHPSGRRYLVTCTEISPSTWIKIYDVTVPTAATLVSEWWTNPGSVVHNVYIKGVYAFVSYYKDGLRVLDLSDPAAPQEVGIYDVNLDNVRGSIFSGTWDIYPYHDALYLDEMYSTVGPNTQGAWIVDFFPGFGQGCTGTGNLVPTQWWSFGPPSPGNAEFSLRLDDARPGTPALLVLGFSNSVWSGMALPLDLAQFGAAGCTLYTSVDSVHLLPTDGAGRSSLPLPIPAGLGGAVYCQWSVLDPGSPNAIGMAVTNGGKLILQ